MGFNATSDSNGRLTRYPGKKEIPCPTANDRTAVLLVVGQSNAANYANHMSTTAFADRVINYHDGRCYEAASPLLGAMGLQGEGWTPLGNMLVASGLYDRVVLIPVAVGATALRRWTKGSDLNRVLIQEIKRSQTLYHITHVLWHQGEADLIEMTSSPAYRKMFLDMTHSLREAGLTAPIYVAVTTQCEPNKSASSDNPVAAAQMSLPDVDQNILAGPNTDGAILESDRYDGCHFRKSGTMKFAAAWFEAIRPSRGGTAMLTQGE